MLKKTVATVIRLVPKRVSYFSTQPPNPKDEPKRETRFEKQQEETDFGYKQVNTKEKQGYVNEVFHSVANNYDIMNDAMSMGVHRLWKDYFVSDLGLITSPNNYQKSKDSKEPSAVVLDVAGGTGDIAFRILNEHKKHQRTLHGDTLQVKVLDINSSMLKVGESRARKQGFSEDDVVFIEGNAEDLHQIKDNSVDVYTIAFGLRNVPRKEKALSEAFRVLKKGGRFMCLEFSKVQNPVLSQLYNFYSFNIIPVLGQVIANDRHSYQYLVESIDKYWDQETFLQKLKEAGFSYANYKNLTDGIVAIHSGFKI